MKKFTLQSIKLILNIIYAPFYIANRLCNVIINYLGIEYLGKVYGDFGGNIIKNTGIIGFIDKWMDFLYNLWEAKVYTNSSRLSMQKEIKEILFNLLPRLLSLPFIAALAVTKGVFMLAVSFMRATNYVLEELAMSAINKLITTIDSYIALYDKDASSRTSHQDDNYNPQAGETLRSMFPLKKPNPGIYSQFSNSSLKPNNTDLNDSPYAYVRSRAGSDESTNSRLSLDN